MWSSWATLLAASFLLAAAGLKLRDRTATAVAVTALGVAGGAARAGVTALALLEAALGLALAAGLAGAAWASTGFAAVLVAGQLGLLAAGRRGMACGCLGPGSTLGPASLRRAAGLGGLSLVAALAGPGGDGPLTRADGTPGGAVLLALAVLAATLLVRALRAAPPDGALEVAEEGPALGLPTPLAAWLPPGSAAPVRLAVFTAAGCRLCRHLEPALHTLAADPAVALRSFEQERDGEVWADAEVPGAPFAVALGADGRVLAKGTVNSAAQLLSVVAAARERGGLLDTSADDVNSKVPGPLREVEGPQSRRGFVGRTAALAGTLTGAASVGSLLVPGDAHAFHFCGHIYTTDSCPHPTGLPRIDGHGRPVRARDGARVDDLGRRIDGQGRPVDDRGRPLADPDGRRLPSAPRTTVCGTTGRRFGLRTRVDGAWYRCCGGKVRKLVDCCARTPNRINGDKALTGYCYDGRKVLCVMYYDTQVPC